MRKKLCSASVILTLIVCLLSCDDDNSNDCCHDPDTAGKVSVDRFSDEAGTLMKRSADASLPGANEPINYDEAPFITMGLGPGGEHIEYYNFDVQTLTPAPIFILFREGEESSVEGQLNIIDVIPGDPGYNDFWKMALVTVPADYKANQVNSYQQIIDNDYSIEYTQNLVNCPVVPEGSTASKRLGSESAGLHRGWYKGKVVYYFTFDEKALTTNASGEIPVSPIYVCFNTNPDSEDPASGPPSGAVTETGSMQTHNVVATLPSDESYSPLWNVNVYDNADFDSVSDLTSAGQANILLQGAMLVNCPVVQIAGR